MVCLILLALIGISPVLSPVEASGATSSTGPACTYDGEVAGFAAVGNDMGELPIDWDNSIHLYLCKTRTDYGTMRYLRAEANTASEYAELARNGDDATKRYPMALCGTSSEAHMIDLAYYYTDTITAISRVEKRNYAAWLSDYATDHDCDVFPETGARRSTCWEQMPTPGSQVARACRERGWTITRHLSISPDGRARTDFGPCRAEDSRRCYWNARTMGNGRGDSFVNHGKLGMFYGLTRINGQRA